MANNRNSKGIFSQVIDFFASVKLAIAILIALAATSVIGTVLPQGEPLEMVVRRYGPTTVQADRVFPTPGHVPFLVVSVAVAALIRELDRLFHQALLKYLEGHPGAAPLC